LSNHIAILLKPYIRLILDGHKTIESRLTKTPMPPFRAVESGDRIYLKASAGPFMATAVADEVTFHEGLTPSKVSALKRRLNKRICGDEQFWQWKRDAKYATFMALRDVEPIDIGPPFEPSRGPAWFVLPDGHPVPAVFDIRLTDGAIRNRYVRVPRSVHVFDRPTYGGPTREQAGRSIRLLMPDGQTVATDVVDNNMMRFRGWGSSFEQAGVKAGDVVRFVEVGPRRFRVRFVKASV